MQPSFLDYPHNGVTKGGPKIRRLEENSMENWSIPLTSAEQNLVIELMSYELASASAR